MKQSLPPGGLPRCPPGPALPRAGTSRANVTNRAGIYLHSAEDLVTWQMDLQVLDNNPIYAGKTFRLNFKFSNSYPIEAPEVMFVRAADRGELSRP